MKIEEKSFFIKRIRISLCTSISAIVGILCNYTKSTEIERCFTAKF